jgi:hypothetical protein
MARKPKATSKTGKATGAAARAAKAAARPAATKRAAASAPPDAASAFGLTDAEIERRLRTGESAGALKDYFGEAQYEELHRLSQQAGTRSVRGGDRVLILPGIMGSTLGQSRAPWPADLIWFDPLDLMDGRLSQLALPPPGKPVIPLGVIAFTYLSLKLRLQIEGFDADFHPYDWRLSVPALGADLAKRIIAERKTHARLHLVAHSMGGLVSRASLAGLTASQRPDRIVMLGTPNYGSYAPVQAFRGVGGTVEKVDWLDRRHSKAELAQIFGAFPGLLEMIPAPGHVRSDLFDLAAWPAAGIRPDAARLTAARAAQAALPVEHPAIVMICGVGRDTVVDVQVKDGEFAYSLSKDGDGCVPLALAKIGTAAKTYYVPEEHGSLPNNGAIQAALPSILATGETSKLADSYAPDGSRGLRTISEAELAARNAPLSRGAPSVSEQRRLLEEFAAPPPAPVATALAGATPPPAPAGTGSAVDPGLSSQIVVGRRRQRRLDVTVARGNITQSDAACYVMGLFDNVTPTGPALDLDAAMGGGLSELVGRRMFGADVGEISILPKGRHPLRPGGGLRGPGGLRPLRRGGPGHRRREPDPDPGGGAHRRLRHRAARGQLGHPFAERPAPTDQRRAEGAGGRRSGPEIPQHHHLRA